MQAKIQVAFALKPGDVFMLNDPVVEPSDLASLEAARFLDLRDPAAFAEAHAPGAVRVPIEAWVAASKAEETSLENTAYWEAEIAALGLEVEEVGLPLAALRQPRHIFTGMKSIPDG